jgi:hypothetical protein
MDKLQTIATLLRKQLAEIEAEIAKNETKPVVEAVEMIDIRSEVAKMSTTKKWKAFVNKDYGVVENVIDLADQLYHYLREHILETSTKEAVDSIIGKIGSEQWSKFIVKVFRHMVKKGSFDREDGSYDDFCDTAGGCDEIFQDECFEVINESLKKFKT